MFEEDPQWNAGIPDAFDDLHRKLFGKIKPEDSKATPLDAAGRRSDKKKKRRGEREVDEEPATVVEGGEKKRSKLSAAAKEHEGSSPKCKKTTRSDQVTVQQEDTSKKPRKRTRSELDQNKEESGPVNAHQTQNETNGAFSGSCATELALKKRRDRSSKLFSKMSGQLEGSRFRMINQQLYTSTGAEAKMIFDSDPELFNVYHRGFVTQVSKWPLNPLDRVIAHVKSLPQSFVISDFGCGEAKLAQSVPHRVHSFDLIAINDRVTACDMAHVPLKKHAVDVCIFCLSLMGSNVSDFIREARRVVKKGGEMRICEVLSRFSSVDDFVRDVEAFGFKLLTKTEFSTMFIEFVFTAVKRDTHTNLPQISLKPCFYKRR